MNKKIVVLGGGTGMAQLLTGLKHFQLDISAIVSVCDDGRSTGRLREEFNLPAVGDIRKVLVALSETDPLVEKLLNYRFDTTSDLNGHTVGNLLLTAMANMTNNLADGIKAIGKVLNLKGKVVPLTEEQVTLVGLMKNGEIVKGEHHITFSNQKIDKVYYEHNPKVNPDALNAIKDADLIILSMGSIYTSIIPNLLCKDIIDAIDKSNAKLMYVCNMMSQPGETDGYKVSDHINVLNSYLGNKKIEVVIANDGIIPDYVKSKYETLEQKDQVILDRENISELGTELITNNYVIIENEIIRHHTDKLALDIFAYLLN